MIRQGLYFELQLDRQPNHGFSVVQFTLQEKISTLFTLTLSLVSHNDALPLNAYLLNKAALLVYTDGVLQRRIEGVISQFERGESGVRRTFYTLTLRPSLWMLTLRHNTRIFHLKSTPEIINAIFDEYHLSYDYRLEDEHKQREYTVQRRETDYEFISRLAAEEGMAIWTQNLNEAREQIYYSDTNAALTRCCAIRYNVHPQNQRAGNYLYNLTFSASMTPQRMQGKDNTPLNPDYPFRHQHQSQHPIADPNLFSHYESYGRYHFPAGSTGANFARYRLEQLQTESEIGYAKSNSIKLRIGSYFVLSEHPTPEMNDAWQVIEVEHIGKQPQSLEEERDGEGAYLTNEVSFIDAGRTYRPPYRYKPMADGPEVATVVGPEGEEIFTNELGQVKVAFHWNRYDKPDENASCWVRVAQGWNGNGYGFYAVPRIGQEVIITYLNGDIDRPLVSGCVYNTKNEVPLNLPEEKTRTTFKTKTHKGKGFNELRFDDAQGKEEIYLHAQKDINTQIVNDESRVVGQHRKTHIHQNEFLKVEGEKREQVAKDYALTVEQTAHIATQGAFLVKSDTDIHLQGKRRIVIDAGDEIVLKVGGTFIQITEADIKTSEILRVEGGAVSLGQLCTPLLPEETHQAFEFSLLLPEMAFSN